MYEVTLVKEDVDGNTSVTAVEFDTSSTPRPPAPTNLVTTLISTDSLSLEWYQPRSDMKILHYTVKYYELLSGDIPGTPRLQTRYVLTTVKFRNFWTPENFAVIYQKFK